MRRIIALLPVIALAACAASPEDIAPVEMSSSAYAGTSCANVRADRAVAMTRLTALYGEQRQARTNDTIGVIILGVPTASLTGGDRATEIGALKGQIAAMDRRC